MQTGAWTSEWSNAVFSLGERELRWGRVRQLMAARGVDLMVCLPCTNSHGRGGADARYLTQLGENSTETIVVFPLDGEVVAWHTTGGLWPSANWLGEVRGTRSGTGGTTVANWLREHPAYQHGTIAIAGLESSLYAHWRAAEGEVNWGSVEIIRRAFPAARIVDGSDLLGEARYQKSDEEIDFLECGTQVAEATLQAVIEHARPGVPERRVFAQMLFANAAAGGSFTPMLAWISGPVGNAYHRLEQPTFRSLQPGDVLITEIEGRWGGHIAQIDESVAIGPAPADLRDGMALACEGFERAFAALRPGVTVGEIMDRGALTGMGGRGETELTLHGRGCGDDGPLGIPGCGEEVRRLTILEGCCFIVKVSTSVDGKPHYGRWGDTVAVTRDGARRLGTRPQVLHELT
jgi:Xaa-Pro aminopeptidase